MSAEYEKAWNRYRELADRAAKGDQQAKREKARVREETHAMEREAAKAGRILSPIVGRDGKVKADVRETDTKRDLQSEYVRRFDNSKPVVISSGRPEEQPIVTDPNGKPAVDEHGQAMRGKVQTLRQYHAKRVLGKNIAADPED